MKEKQLDFKGVLQYGAMTIMGSILCLSLVPLLFPLFAFFIIVSSIVVALIKLKYGAKGTKAVGMDVLSGKETDVSYPVINVSFRFRGKMDVEKVRRRTRDVVLHSYDEGGNRKYKRLTQIYEKRFGYYVWRDSDQFDICQHVKSVRREDIEILQKKSNNLPKDNEENDRPSSPFSKDDDTLQWEELMKEFLNKYAMGRFTPGVPLWELLLLEENDERYTVLFRFHHCIADGIYVSRMLCEEFLDSPTKLFHSYVPPTKLRKTLRNLWSFSLLPFGLWKILKNKDKNVLLPPTLTGRKKYYVSEPVPMALLKEIKAETSVSVHGVLFSCLSAALASHFQRRNSVTNEITTLIPMPLQNLQKPIELKNRYAVISLKIPTVPSSINEKDSSKLKSNHQIHRSESQQMHPLERLNIIRKIIEEAKSDPAFLSVHSLINAFCTFFPSKLAEALLSTKGTSVAFSSIPGPHEILFFEGDELEEVMFWIPDRNPLGAGFSILSYDKVIRVGLALDEALLEDETEGDLIIKDFVSEIDVMAKCLRTEEKQIVAHKDETHKLLKTIP